VFPGPPSARPIREQDVAQLVRFLLKPAEGEAAAYERQYAKVERELTKLRAVASYSGKLTLGNSVSELEQRMVKFLGTQYALFLTNWTAGAEIVYKYVGLKEGDEIIAPAITFIATIAYPLSVGAKVVFGGCRSADRSTLIRQTSRARSRPAPR